MKIRSLRGVFAAALTALGVGLLSPGESRADPISVIGTFHFRDVRGDNDAGFAVGDRLTFGIDVRPNPRTGDPGTTVTAAQGAITAQPLNYLDSPALPNQYGSSLPYSPAFTGPWALTIRNPNSSNSPVTVNTPDVGDAPAIEHVRNMSLTPGVDVTRPTFNWTLPPAGTFASVSILIQDLDDKTSFGFAKAIHSAGNLPLTVGQYAVPEVLNAEGTTLKVGGNYSVSIQLDQRRANGSLLSRSRSFFNFRPRADATPTVFLPTVSANGVFHFRLDVVDGEVVFIDPPVAVGYDYATGPGDPNFASVILPAVGDGVFRLHFLAGGVPAEETVVAGEQFFFPAGGVAAFGVRGIEATAALNPDDATAFVTGLTFVADGAFTGTMTPVVLNLGADPTCNGLAATIFVRDGRIVGGPDHGQPYRGVLTGTNGDDVIVGTEKGDRIKAFAGDDTVCALGGDDVIDGGDGDDWIEGGPGNDQIKGGRGNDTILAGDGDDVVEGGPGDDWIDGGRGHDRIKGQDGNDTILGGEGDDIIDGGPGDDAIDGGPGTNSIKG
jgi:hypothetical protein